MNDPISRAELFDELNRQGVPYNAEVNMVINWMPSVQPYTDEEIQAMQNLEQAQLDKAYELGWEEGREALRRETGKMNENDLISRQAAIDAIEERKGEKYETD